MKQSLKDLDKIIGSLNPELQCGEGVLADVCRWHIAFKKQLEEFRNTLLNDLVNEQIIGNKVDANFVLWMVNDILGESKENGESGESKENKESRDTYEVTDDVRDRALSYHKLTLSDF